MQSETRANRFARIHLPSRLVAAALFSIGVQASAATHLGVFCWEFTAEGHEESAILGMDVFDEQAAGVYSLVSTEGDFFGKAKLGGGKVIATLNMLTPEERETAWSGNCVWI